MRSFYILNSRSESSSTHVALMKNEAIRMPERRERLRYRDMVWAFHSESQGILLQASMTACEGKMNLMDAKALGVFLWLKSLDSVVRGQECQLAQAEHCDTERSHGGGGKKSVHGWRVPRSHSVLSSILRAWQGQACARPVASGYVAQGTTSYAQVSHQ